MNAIIPANGNTALTPTSMESAFKLAEMMALGKLVPAHLQKSPGDCLMVIEASMRWGMSPFAVAQCTSVIQGKLMFEGKLVAAALNASGILSERLDYDFDGDGAQRAVTVRGTLRGETKPREVTVFLQDAKTTNGMWTKQPDQQLVYAGTRVWARRHAPEVMLGVYTPEEFDRAEPFNGTTIDHTEAEPEAPPQRVAPDRPAAAAPMPRGATVREPAPPRLKPEDQRYLDEWQASFDEVTTLDAVKQLETSKQMRDALGKESNVIKAALLAMIEAATSRVMHAVPDRSQWTDAQWETWISKLNSSCAVLYHHSELDETARSPSVEDAIANGPDWVKRDTSAILAKHSKRLRQPADEQLPEVEIVGERYLGAG